MHKFSAVCAIFASIAGVNAQPPITQPKTSVVRLDLSPDGYFHSAPDPDSSWELFFCVRDQRVVQEFLELTDEQIEVIEKLAIDFLKAQRATVVDLKNSGDKEIAAKVLSFREEISTAGLDEILTPDQIGTLRQIAMRLEILRIGLPDALVRGRLARKVGVFDEQKGDLWRQATEIEAETRRKIDELVKESEAKILDLLAPEQRTAAVQLLGDTISLHEETEHQKIYREHANTLLNNAESKRSESRK